MKTTNKSTVTLLDNMGTDLTIVNAARVSFDKESSFDYLEDGCICAAYSEYECGCEQFEPTAVLKQQDKKLIGYLAKHGHWSPFAHTSIQIRVDAPVFVARQLVKHQVGGVWNEVSRRYVDDEPVFYFPDKWRKRADNVKQGSSDEHTTKILHDDGEFAWSPEQTISHVLYHYNTLIRRGVAPEQARMILPQNMMTSWYWTGSLMFFHRVFKQRTDSHAQLETQEVALQIGEICANLFPVSWEALNNKEGS